MSEPEDIPEAKYLGPLESFDPKILLPADKSEKAICSFILALALVFNDVKDCRLAIAALRPFLPKVPTITAAAGQGFGLEKHLNRHFYAVLYELMVLIKKNPRPQASLAFRDTVSSLAKGDRKVWEDISELANRRPQNSPVLGALVRVRDNTAAHYYGLDELAKGYGDFFSKGGPLAENAYLSRGGNVAASRFYFADAAVQGYENIAVQALSPGELGELSQKISLVLFQIVTRFIERRAGGFYTVR